MSVAHCGPEFNPDLYTLEPLRNQGFCDLYAI